MVSWLVLLAFLVLAQVLVARRFRRVVNLGLALATVVALASGAFALNRLGDSSAHLTGRREQAFDSVHVLARARATVVSARQAQGQFLLDPATADGARAAFQDQVRRLLGFRDRTWRTWPRPARSPPAPAATWPGWPGRRPPAPTPRASAGPWSRSGPSWPRTPPWGTS